MEKAVFVVVFQEWQNLELLRGYPYFQNALLIFMIFLNKHGRAITVGMYAHDKTPPYQVWLKKKKKAEQFRRY